MGNKPNRNEASYTDAETDTNTDIIINPSIVGRSSSSKMSYRQTMLLSGYLRKIRGENETEDPEDIMPADLRQILIAYYLLYGEAFVCQPVNIQGTREESFLVPSSVKLFGKNNLPFVVTFDVKFFNKPNVNHGWPHNMGYHGGCLLGLESDTKPINRWNDENSRCIIDWADHMSWIPNETRSGYRLYRNHGMNDYLRSNSKYHEDIDGQGMLRQFFDYENDGKYGNWKIIYDRDGKATFTVNDEIIFVWTPVSYQGFVGFWAYGNRVGLSIKNVMVSMIV